jgi:hypothetical protein
MRYERLLSIVLVGLVIVHGLIHSMGFVKAFDLAEVSELTLDISRPVGALWLITAVLFVSVAVLFVARRERWWVLAVPTVVLSQALIIGSWQDSMFGTLPNILILAVALQDAFEWRFGARVGGEMEAALSRSDRHSGRVVTGEMTRDLPGPVRRWLEVSGIVGKVMARNAYHEQRGSIRLRPGRGRWSNVEAVQLVDFEEPTLIWNVRMSVLPMLHITGRDRYADGRGEMEVRLASMVPIVDASSSPKLDQAALQRFLGEIVLSPSAALSPYITWEPIDERSARATMTHGGTTGSATFHFDEGGGFSRVEAMRYRNVDDGAPTGWEAKAVGMGRVGGIRVPTRFEITWMLPEGPFTWYRFEVRDISFNVEHLPGRADTMRRGSRPVEEDPCAVGTAGGQ